MNNDSIDDEVKVGLLEQSEDSDKGLSVLPWTHPKEEISRIYSVDFSQGLFASEVDDRYYSCFTDTVIHFS